MLLEDLGSFWSQNNGCFPNLLLFYLLSGARHDFLRDGADLTVHLQHLLLHQSNMKDPEVCAAQVQRQEVAFLCREEQTAADGLASKVSVHAKVLRKVTSVRFSLNVSA